MRVLHKICTYTTKLSKPNIEESKITRTAWAVFKYCGTKTVTLRMKKK